MLTADDGNITRKPLLLFRLSGVFLFRLAERVFLELLFHEPPRNTRVPVLPCTRRHSTPDTREKIVEPSRPLRNVVQSACSA